VSCVYRLYHTPIENVLAIVTYNLYHKSFYFIKIKNLIESYLSDKFYLLTLGRNYGTL
jgi:hypothetical protein